MHWAEQQGLFQVTQTMSRFAAMPHGDADFWQPASLLQARASGSGTFSQEIHE